MPLLRQRQAGADGGRRRFQDSCRGQFQFQGQSAETGAVRQIIIGKLALPGGIGVVTDGAKDTIYVADVFACRTVDGATGEVSEPARMHAAGVTLEYPMSATAKGDDVIMSSWFTAGDRA